MKKLSILFLVVLALSILLVACDDDKNKPTNSGYIQEEELSPEERVVKDNESVKVDTPDFMNRSGYKVTKEDYLSNVKYDNIYSQTKSRAQIDLSFDDERKATLLLDKTDLYSDSEENMPDVYLIAGVDVTFLVGDDGLKTYYYKKDSVYYSFSTYDTFTNEELFDIVGGFNTEIGENF